MSNVNFKKVYAGKRVYANLESENARPVHIEVGVVGHYLSVSDAEALAKELSEAVKAAKGGARHYPPGMGEESRRLHREYAALEAAQRAGAKNGAEVVRVTDECAAKGIILVPGGENL
jgi:hypothetical protein